MAGIVYSLIGKKHGSSTGSGIQGTFPSNRTLLSTLFILHRINHIIDIMEFLLSFLDYFMKFETQVQEQQTCDNKGNGTCL